MPSVIPEFDYRGGAFVDAQGRLTQSARIFLRDLQLRTGGTSTVTLPEVNNTVTEVVTRVEALESGFDITPLDPQYGAKGDGVTDDSEAINAAIEYAASIAPGRSEGVVVVDLKGRTYGIGSAIDLRAASNVKLCNGTILCLPGWTGGEYAVNALATGGAPVYDIALDDLTIDCNYVCNSGIGCRNTRNCQALRVTILRFQVRGWYVINSGPATWDLVSCRAQKFYFSDPGYEDFYQRTGIGFDIDSSDCVLTDCLANFCKTPLRIGAAGCNINGGHYFNGDAEPLQQQIGTYGDNGAGALRYTYATAHNYTTGQYILLPWMPEISPGFSGGNTRPWPATVVDPLTVDFLDFTVGVPGTYVAAVGKKTMLWDDEPEAVRIVAGASGVNLVGTQFDSSKVVIEGGVIDVSMVGCHWAMGNAYNKHQLELVTTRVDEVWSGVVIVANRFANGGDVRVWAKDGGTLDPEEQLTMFSNARKNGGLVGARGVIPFPGGSKARPGFVATASADNPDATVVDFGTGMFGPNDDSIGFTTKAKQRLLVTLADGTIIGDNDETASQFLQITSGASYESVFSLNSAGVPRWQIRRSTAGNFSIQAREDDGTFRATDLAIDRTSGLVTLGANSRTGVRLRLNTAVATTATAGTRTLPANPAGFIRVQDETGTEVKIPYYAP